MGRLTDAPTFWSVHADQNVTRRKWYHIAVDQKGNPQYHSRQLGDCLEACEEAGQTEIYLKLPNGRVWRMEPLGKLGKEPL